MKISIIGAGYVGLPSAAVFADFGNTVWVIRRDKEKIKKMKQGLAPIYEPGLDEIMKRNIAAGRLIPTTKYSEAVPESEIVFICVGTPQEEDGSADLSQVAAAAKEIARNMKGYTVIVNKSTVPIGTAEFVKNIINENKKPEAEFDVVSCPEFLREGCAVNDSLNPDKIVIGIKSERARDLMIKLHEPLSGERVVTSIETAEMIKYANNALLATEVSYINNVAQVCDQVGADVEEVAYALRLDKRIGKFAFLSAGTGYGGGCFPKDVRAFINIADKAGVGFKILEEVENFNKKQQDYIYKKTAALLEIPKGKKVVIWGLAFKANTDDLRKSPSIVFIKKLLAEGVRVAAHDPRAILEKSEELREVEFFSDMYQALDKADLLVVMVDWDDYKKADYSKVKELMHKPAIFDARNALSRSELQKKGFIYLGMGRGK